MHTCLVQSKVDDEPLVYLAFLNVISSMIRNSSPSNVYLLATESMYGIANCYLSTGEVLAITTFAGHVIFVSELILWINHFA